MSDSETAYERARAAIARAKDRGAARLELSGRVGFEALDRLPPEIGDLTALQSLDLRQTQVADLAPLAGLTALEILSLHGTRVADLRPLAGLTALKYLSLSRTKVAVLSLLAGLTGLENLDLDGTPVTDLSPLSGLSALRDLQLENTMVADLRPLAGMTALERLGFSGTQVADLSPLAGMTALEHLGFGGTQVADLSPLAGMTALRGLYLSGTQVADLSPLAGLTGLKTLSLSRTQVADLSPLTGLTGLQRLDIDGTQVADLSPLAGLTALKIINLDRTKVADLSPLAGMTALEHLGFGGTQVADVSPLAGLTTLRDLHLTNAMVADLRPLAGMTALESLGLSSAQVVDLAPLSGLSALKKLWLAGTKVADLSPLAALTGLELLSLARTPVADLTPLSGLTALQTLWLGNTPAADLRPLRGLTRLAEDPRSDGLQFKDCAATKADPRIAEIAKIADNAERVQTLFDYLDGWEPPEAEEAPQPDPRAAAPFVFLSYARADLRQVQAVHTVLRNEGIPLWWDQDIPADARWREEIADRLGAAAAVLTLWTAASTASDAVREEASTAQRTRRLVHARMDDAQLPFGFAETNYMYLQDWDGTPTHPEMRKLLQTLRDKLNPPTAEEMAQRLGASSPVAMLPAGGRLTPRDTPPNAPAEVDNPVDLAARLDGLRQILPELRAKAQNRDRFQLPEDLDEALARIGRALHADRPNWYALDNARAALRDCMEDHDAAGTWNAPLVRDLRRFAADIAALRPLLQPRQVPPGEPGAKPPAPDPVVRQDQIDAVAALAEEAGAVFASPEAAEVLDDAARDLARDQIAEIEAAARAKSPGIAESPVRFARLRRGLRGLAWVTGGTVAAIGTPVIVNLLTAPEAAATLAARLKPILDAIVKYFL